MLNKQVSVSELNRWLEKNVDTLDLSDNYLDGHGFEKLTNKTVYMINNVPTVFDLDDTNANKDRWFYIPRILKIEDIVLWKDFNRKNKNPKMESRF